MTATSAKVEELIAEWRECAHASGYANRIYMDTADALASLNAEVEGLRAILEAIKRHGELGNVQVGSLWGSSGEKPPSKDVWQFPRHMLAEIDEALAIRAALSARES